MSNASVQGTAGVNVPESNALTIIDILTNTSGSPITLLITITPTGPQRLRGSSGSGGDHK